MLAEAQTLPITPTPAGWPATALQDDAGSASLRDRLNTRAGTRDYADLPHRHPRCNRRWSGSLTAHCAACCETFSGVSAFDRHRDGRPKDPRYPAGVCYYPGDCGLVLLPGRAYRCWGTVTAAAVAVLDARARAARTPSCEHNLHGRCRGLLRDRTPCSCTCHQDQEAGDA